MECQTKVLQIDLDAVIASKSKRLAKYTPKFVINKLKKLIHQQELNQMLKEHHESTGLRFAKDIIEDLEVTCNIKYRDKESINKDKRYIIVSNHPLGGLDGLALIKEFGDMFLDIKFVVNDILLAIKPLSPLFIPVNKHGAIGKEAAQQISEAYSSSAQILYFPAGLCSRLINGEVTDTPWKINFLKQAIKHNRDIIPVHFIGKNSKRFYRIAKIRKALGINFNIEMLFLPDEMFKKRGAQFDVIIGKPIPISSIDKTKSLKEWCNIIREECYSL